MNWKDREGTGRNGVLQRWNGMLRCHGYAVEPAAGGVERCRLRRNYLKNACAILINKEDGDGRKYGK